MGQVEALGEKFAAVGVEDDDEADFQFLKRRRWELGLDVTGTQALGKFVGQIPGWRIRWWSGRACSIRWKSAGGAGDVSPGEILFQAGEAAHQNDARESKKAADQAKHGDADDQQSLPPKGGRHTELGNVEGHHERPQEPLYRSAEGMDLAVS